MCISIRSNITRTFSSSDFLSSVKYESIGCYRDQNVTAIPPMERSDVLLKDSYSQRNDAIQKCALAAKVRGYQTFALQDGGMCLSGPNATETFDKFGKSQGCKNDGKGGVWDNQVYNLTGTMEGTVIMKLKTVSYTLM